MVSVIEVVVVVVKVLVCDTPIINMGVVAEVMVIDVLATWGLLWWVSP